MKLITFESRGDLSAAPRLGAISGDGRVVDLLLSASAAFRSGSEVLTSMLALIDGGPAALEMARAAFETATIRGVPEAVHDISTVRLLAPLPNPRRLRDCGCFLQHLRNCRAVRYRRLAAQEADPAAAMERFRAAGELDIQPEWIEAPLMLNGNHLSIAGSDVDIPWPDGVHRLDFELELAMITRGTGRNIESGRAADHIFGYTIFNDLSARDIQARDIAAQLGLAGRAKDFDSGNVLGPCIVTADELADPYALSMVARVNGEEWGRGSSGQMDHRFDVVLMHASRNQTIYAGEVLGSGTVPTGCGLESDRYLADGDLVELEIENIGVLRNRVVKPPHWQARW